MLFLIQYRTPLVLTVKFVFYTAFTVPVLSTVDDSASDASANRDVKKSRVSSCLRSTTVCHYHGVACSHAPGACQRVSLTLFWILTILTFLIRRHDPTL